MRIEIQFGSAGVRIIGYVNKNRVYSVEKLLEAGNTWDATDWTAFLPNVSFEDKKAICLVAYKCHLLQEQIVREEIDTDRSIIVSDSTPDKTNDLAGPYRLVILKQGQPLVVVKPINGLFTPSEVLDWYAEVYDFERKLLQCVVTQEIRYNIDTDEVRAANWARSSLKPMKGR